MLSFIADPGQNYIDVDDLKALATKCKETGFDIFKPQVFSTDQLYSTDWKHYNLVKKHELSLMDAEEVFYHCEHIGIECMFSVFDIARIKYCTDIGTTHIKVANRMCDNLEFLHAIKESELAPIISVSKTRHLPYFTYDNMFGKNYQLLYTVPSYPAIIEHYSIPMIKICDGLSNHVLDNGALAYASVGAGVSTIELHVYNKDNIVDSPDMCVSYSTKELDIIIENCKKIENIRGI